MCGIIGIIGQNSVSERLVDGLFKLEYRGYDSAGIATIDQGVLQCRRVQGKISALQAAVQQLPIHGVIGIGHTRWATHGIPNAINAHPHVTDHVAVVHNGIIENFKELREFLAARGCTFRSDTDTEVIPLLVTYFLSQGASPEEALQCCLEKLHGAFAIAVLFAAHEDVLLAARKGSPLAIGYGDKEMYLGSDAYALAPLTSRVSYLEDGDWAVLTRDNVTIYDEHNEIVTRPIKHTNLAGNTIGKGNFRHFMAKEIHEQPCVIGETLSAYSDIITAELKLPDMPFKLETISRITIVACGTSYFAGMVAKYWLESIAAMPTDIHIASEFRYGHVNLTEGGAALFISQSGETSDTLAALAYAKQHKQHIISVVNVEESSMARASDVVLPIYAGPEIGVASTKAFTCQLVVLLLFSLNLGLKRSAINIEKSKQILSALIEVPSRIAEILHHEEQFKELSTWLSQASHILYIGRGFSFPIALEGALKLKEISYIHAEGIAAGELKHGTIALVDEHIPIIAIAPTDAWFEKTASNISEIIARSGNVLLISDKKGVQALSSTVHKSIELASVHPMITPILYTIPIQLLAYHTAVHKGTDVDQPRNLAKSVTVE